MKYILVTNNPKVFNKYGKPGVDRFLTQCKYLEGQAFIHVLEWVRDRVHEGHQLLTHPLTGSVKPYETPYKSVLIAAEKKRLDMDSLKIIEDALTLTKKFLEDYEPRELPERIHQDFQLIDYNLIESGIESLHQIH